MPVQVTASAGQVQASIHLLKSNHFYLEMFLREKQLWCYLIPDDGGGWGVVETKVDFEKVKVFSVFNHKQALQTETTKHLSVHINTMNIKFLAYASVLVTLTYFSSTAHGALTIEPSLLAIFERIMSDPNIKNFARTFSGYVSGFGHQGQLRRADHGQGRSNFSLLGLDQTDSIKVMEL